MVRAVQAVPNDSGTGPRLTDFNVFNLLNRWRAIRVFAISA
jgi:hypothetical protein